MITDAVRKLQDLQIMQNSIGHGREFKFVVNNKELDEIKQKYGILLSIYSEKWMENDGGGELGRRRGDTSKPNIPGER